MCGWQHQGASSPNKLRASLAATRSSIPYAIEIELQAEAGRGTEHLTYDLSDGDLVAYQVGTWLVDSVEVGDGSPARLLFARVDVLQINWCAHSEHGFVRGTALQADHESIEACQQLHLTDEEIQFGPEQLVARLPASWLEDGMTADLLTPLPPVQRLLITNEAADDVDDVPPPPPPPPPPQQQAMPWPPLPLRPTLGGSKGGSSRVSRGGHAVIAQMLECTEENVISVLESFKAECTSMFGCHAEAARLALSHSLALRHLSPPSLLSPLSPQRHVPLLSPSPPLTPQRSLTPHTLMPTLVPNRIGITGDLTLHGLDGPVVVVSLSGRFWHKRETVLRNCEVYLTRAIPEVFEVAVADEDDLLDKLIDEETGAVVEDRRSPDYNGDREALEYQGIDPDTRGPFPNGVGGLRPGGSMFS